MHFWVINSYNWQLFGNYHFSDQFVLKITPYKRDLGVKVDIFDPQLELKIHFWVINNWESGLGSGVRLGVRLGLRLGLGNGIFGRRNWPRAHCGLSAPTAHCGLSATRAHTVRAHCGLSTVLFRIIILGESSFGGLYFSESSFRIHSEPSVGSRV